MGSVVSRTVNDVQTVTVPPGGAVITEIRLEVPGKYVLVDHALSRVNKGLASFLEVIGPDDPTIFKDNLDTSVTEIPKK